MDIETLCTIIANGEDLRTEFKECRDKVTHEIYPTICAFSNRMGGYLLLGVADDGTVTGVIPEAVSSVRRDIVTTLNNPDKIYPIVYLSIEQYTIDDKIILCIYVPRSSQVHTWNMKTYDRNNDADIDISRSPVLMSELYLRKQTEFSELKIFPYIKKEHLMLELLPMVKNLTSVDYKHPWFSMSDDDILRSAGLYAADYLTGKQGYNLAAILLFGRPEVIRSILPGYKFDAIYRKYNMDRYDDRLVVGDNLLLAYDSLVNFIMKHADDRFFLLDGMRVSVLKILSRELISNMLIHQEYVSNHPARLIIEPTRIITENASRVYQYGKLTEVQYTPHSKNPVIAKFFRTINRADELGSGIRNLYKMTRIYTGNKEPNLFDDIVFKAEIPLDYGPQRTTLESTHNFI